MTTIEGHGRAAGFRFAIVVSKYNDFVTDRLQAGALAALAGAGVSSRRRWPAKPSIGSPTSTR